MAAPEWMAVPKDLLAMQRTLEQVSLILKVEQIAKQWGPCIESEQQVVMRRIIVSVERQPIARSELGFSIAGIFDLEGGTVRASPVCGGRPTVFAIDLGSTPRSVYQRPIGCLFRSIASRWMEPFPSIPPTHSPCARPSGAVR